MISEVDIADWDKASQQAYLEWCESYGIDYEPWIGVPDVAAAWKAAVDWTRKQQGAQGWRKRQIGGKKDNHCPYCRGFGEVDTGVMESPVTVCNSCNGTGLKDSK